MHRLEDIKSGTMMNANRYRVISEIQRGGTAIVLLAFDEKTKREVALKCMHVSSTQQEPTVPVR